MDTPKEILEHLDRIGNQYAWVDKLRVNWNGEEKVTYRAGLPHGVFVLALTEDGLIPLVHQYRVLGRGWTYELPGGLLEKTESPETCAIRELEEEAGYKAGQIEPLLNFNPSPVMRMQVHLFIARKLEKTEQNLEPGESELTVKTVTPTQLWEMVLDGTITDSQTILATLLAKERGYLDIKKKPEPHP